MTDWVSIFKTSKKTIMAIIKPFKGVRPPKDLVEQVESRPYDVLNSEEAREEAGDNEKSLYHIIKPEINFEPGTSEYDPRVYESAAENFKKFQKNIIYCFFYLLSVNSYIRIAWGREK